ncbi:UNVERIFIED_CONTAM: hypothetical protein RMT77_014546 [Armadillidium vulgare]
MSCKVMTPRKIIRELDQISDNESDFSDDDSIEDPDYVAEFLGFSDDEIDARMNEIVNRLTLEENEEEERENEENIDIEDEDIDRADEVPVWTEYANRQKVFYFTGKSGLQIIIPQNVTPIEVFRLFINDEVLDLLVEQTNIFAQQQIAIGSSQGSKKPIKQHSRIKACKEEGIDKKTIEMFLGTNLWMGLNRKGSIDEYWSKSPLFESPLTEKLMSRNKFQLLLNLVHFADNNSIEKGNRIGKIAPLIDLLVKNFQSVFCPPKDVVIDETLVPWRGRLIFRQYIPQKAHKYGIKLFKLCTTEGYTYNFSVYSGKQEGEYGVAKKVCEKLMHNLLNEGRTLYVDNFYTSYELALSMLRQKTHLVGTVRSSERNMPKDVALAKLKRGEMKAKEDTNGIVYLKWKDTRDVRIISSKHKPEMVLVRSKKRGLEDVGISQLGCSGEPQPLKRRRTEEHVVKPEAVIAYNKGKTGIDLSDQMASYATTLRKGVKWFTKLGLELLLGLSMVNAHYIYQYVTKKKLGIRQFRIKVTESLLKCEQTQRYKSPKQKQTHMLKTQKNAANKIINRICKHCYDRYAKCGGRNEAKKKASKSNYYCTGCIVDGKNVYMCRPCFEKHHQ